MDATDEERIPLGDSDGFLTVLSRIARKKQRMEEAHNVGGTGEQEPSPSPPPAVDVLDQVDSSTLCQHILGHVPADQIPSCMLNAMAITADETGRPLAERVRERLSQFSQAGSGQAEEKEKLELSSLPG